MKNKKTKSDLWVVKQDGLYIACLLEAPIKINIKRSGVEKPGIEGSQDEKGCVRMNSNVEFELEAKLCMHDLKVSTEARNLENAGNKKLCSR
jgi:hypothetical protein